MIQLYQSVNPVNRLCARDPMDRCQMEPLLKDEGERRCGWLKN